MDDGGDMGVTRVIGMLLAFAMSTTSLRTSGTTLPMLLLCNATARRSSTTCTIEVRGGEGREFGLGTQLDDEKVDSVPHRST